MGRGAPTAFVGLLIASSALGLSGCGGDGDGSEASQPTATSTAGVSHRDLSGAELARWQSDLNAVGCWAGAVDGGFGPQTELAVEEFQAAAGLVVDGKLGPQTEGALDAAVKAGKTVCSPGKVPGGSTAAVTVSSPSYSKSFSVTSCVPTQGGTTGVVLSASGTGGFRLVVDAPSGRGTMAISGGSEQDGVELSGTVQRAMVSDAAVEVSGSFSNGEAVTVKGYCA